MYFSSGTYLASKIAAVDDFDDYDCNSLKPIFLGIKALTYTRK
jgi:hypothetical protein